MNGLLNQGYVDTYVHTYKSVFITDLVSSKIGASKCQIQDYALPPFSNFRDFCSAIASESSNCLSDHKD